MLMHIGCIFGSAAENVQVLTEDSFDRKVKSSDEFWIVEFFAPWCGHCQKLAPEFEIAATNLKSKANFGAVDCTSEEAKSICGQYSVHSFPTIKGFGKNKKKPKDYSGPRDAKGLEFYVKSACKRGLCKKKKKKGSSDGKSKEPNLVENIRGPEDMHKFIHKYSNRKVARVVLFGKSKGALALVPPSWYQKIAARLADSDEQSLAFIPNSKAGQALLAQFELNEPVVLPLLVVASSSSYSRLDLEPKQKLTEALALGFIERHARTMADAEGDLGDILPHALPEFGNFKKLEL
jgi:protein disulfide-isomerase A6